MKTANKATVPIGFRGSNPHMRQLIPPDASTSDVSVLIESLCYQPINTANWWRPEMG